GDRRPRDIGDDDAAASELAVESRGQAVAMSVRRPAKNEGAGALGGREARTVEALVVLERRHGGTGDGTADEGEARVPGKVPAGRGDERVLARPGGTDDKDQRTGSGLRHGPPPRAGNRRACGSRPAAP